MRVTETNEGFIVERRILWWWRPAICDSYYLPWDMDVPAYFRTQAEAAAAMLELK